MGNATKKTLFMAQFGVLLAIEAIFCFTPLGSLPALGPVVATLMLIPVAITAILLGTSAGAAMGAFAGLFSFLVWTFMPPPQSAIIAFVFTPFSPVGQFSGNFGSVLICFAPRMLAGFVVGAVFEFLGKIAPKKKLIAYSLSAAAGSIVNTVGVVGGISLFFGESYASVAGSTMLALAGVTIVFSGIPEAAVNAILAAAVCRPLKAVLKNS